MLIEPDEISAAGQNAGERRLVTTILAIKRVIGLDAMPGS